MVNLLLDKAYSYQNYQYFYEKYLNNDTLSLVAIKIKLLKVTKSNKNNGLITQDWLKFTMSSLARYICYACKKMTKPFSQYNNKTISNNRLRYPFTKKADILLCQLIYKLKMIYGLKLSFKVTIRLNTKCSGE